MSSVARIVARARARARIFQRTTDRRLRRRRYLYVTGDCTERANEYARRAVANSKKDQASLTTT